MDARGWGWTPSEIRQAQLIEWIVPQTTEHYLPVKPFYDDLPDQSANTFQVAHSDLRSLERRSLAGLAAGLGGIESLDVMATPQARELAEELQAARASKPLRKAACRDAMTDWLYSLDAVSPPGPARDRMLDDPGRGTWFGLPFPAGDLDAAAAWLERNGLPGGRHVDQYAGPVLLYLTDAGVRCAEDFGSDTGRYLDKRQQAPSGSGHTFNIGTNSGPFQVAGDRARQLQKVGASAADLQLVIAGITEIVRALVPGVPDADAEERAALAAVGATGADQSALQRFRDWALSALRAGSTSAAVAAVSSVTTTLLIDAGHLATHLG
jgi:hypothetical protein